MMFINIYKGTRAFNNDNIILFYNEAREQRNEWDQSRILLVLTSGLK